MPTEWFFDVQTGACPTQGFEQLTVKLAESITKVAASCIVIVLALNELWQEFSKYKELKDAP